MENTEQPGLSNTPVVRTSSVPTSPASLRILIDWLGFTFKSDETRVSDVLAFFEDYLGINPKWFKPGRKNYEGYANSLVFENINIYYQGALNQGIHVDLTGQGCRYLDFIYEKLRVQDEKFLNKHGKLRVHNWYDMLELLWCMEDVSFTRLDIACDDFHGYLDIMHMFKKCLDGELTMKFRSWSPNGKFDSDGHSHGLTLYFGSKQSDIQCRIYEKGKQLKVDYHWNRVELQFSKRRCEEMVKQILSNKNMEIGVHFAGVLKNYLTFRVPNEKDSNKRRWPVATWWDNFLRGVPRLQIASALPDRSIVKSKKWIDEQVSRTIARLFFAYQDISDDWMADVLKSGMMKLDEEDLRMIEEFRRLYGKNAQKVLKENFAFTQEKTSTAENNGSRK
ncbi:replication initiation factor domain-containing protein [Priestia megaterium]|uniref:replication initiation factor domain-containing protein n=1 Tax=Priestia megaterium TaxID=1404 RepID=UPI003009A7A8